MEQNVTIKNKEVLSDEKYLLQKITFNYTKKDGETVTKTNEVFNPGDAVTVLLYNKESGKIILTKQFRLPSYINGNESGMLIEACAGKVEKESPEAAVKREIEEETGYKVETVKQVFEAYTTPGAVTEKLYFFVASYTQSMKVGEGGGLEKEQEDIEVLELTFEEALQMMESNEIKDVKTILLLQYAKLHQLL